MRMSKPTTARGVVEEAAMVNDEEKDTTLGVAATGKAAAR